MAPHKIGFIKLKYNNKILRRAVYINKYIIYFRLLVKGNDKKKYKHHNIYWSTKKKGFPKDYIKMMRTQVFPISYVKKEKPTIAEGKIKK
jgi:hypothetical protein